MGCGAETEANVSFAALVEGLNFGVPDINLDDPLLKLPTTLSDRMYEKVKGVSTEDLTTREFGGTGVFDALMQSVSIHLKKEYTENRLSGAEYAKAYVALTQAAMTNAVQFTLGKDQSFWDAQKAQVAAISARAELEKGKMDLNKARVDALTAQVNYGATKIRLATEGQDFCIKKYNLDFMLPQQLATATANTVLAQANKDIAVYNRDYMMPQQLTMLREQTEAARAQTADIRIDGSTINGTLGKQRELYSQQIISYEKDARIKGAKLFTDAWTVMKTIDEGLVPPSRFTNASVDQVLTKIQADIGIT